MLAASPFLSWGWAPGSHQSLQAPRPCLENVSLGPASPDPGWSGDPQSLPHTVLGEEGDSSCCRLSYLPSPWVPAPHLYLRVWSWTQAPKKGSHSFQNLFLYTACRQWPRFRLPRAFLKMGSTCGAEPGTRWTAYVSCHDAWQQHHTSFHVSCSLVLNPVLPALLQLQLTAAFFLATLLIGLAVRLYYGSH
jgi:hypothetical protein